MTGEGSGDTAEVIDEVAVEGVEGGYGEFTDPDEGLGDGRFSVEVDAWGGGWRVC